MKNVLPAPSLHVEYQFIACAVDSQFLSDLLCPEDQFRDNRTIRFSQIIDAPDMIPRDKKNVHRSMWLDVFKGDDRFTFIDDLGRFFPPDDLAEDTVFQVNIL